LDKGRSLGWDGLTSFNTDFERRLPATAGSTVVLTATGSAFPLPSAYRDEWSPLSSLQLEAALRERASGRADRVLADGTHVILLYGRDENALKVEVDHLVLDPR